MGRVAGGVCVRGVYVFVMFMCLCDVYVFGIVE